MRSLAVLAFLVSPTMTWAQLRIEPPVRDLGDVRGGVAVECDFKITNAGAADVELVDLERSCGCVEPRFSVRTLKPGEQATLSLRIRTLGQLEGPRLWPLTLVSRASNEMTKQSLAVRGVVANEITLQPPQIALVVNKSVEQEITLVDRRERPLTVTSWEAKMPGVRVDQLASKPGTTRLKLSATAELLPKGRQDHVLHLYTNDVRYAHLEIPVVVTRVEKPRVSWSPDPPEVILAPGEAKGSTLIRVKGEASFAIDKVEASDAGVTCAWREADDGGYVRVTVERTRFQGLQTSIRVVSGGEVVAIPIVVRMEVPRLDREVWERK